MTFFAVSPSGLITSVQSWEEARTKALEVGVHYIFFNAKTAARIRMIQATEKLNGEQIHKYLHSCRAGHNILTTVPERSGRALVYKAGRYSYAD